MESDRIHSYKSLIWGVFLILIGAGFLLEQTGAVDWPGVGQLWPLVFFVIAAIHVVERRPGGAVMFVLIGTWFFANVSGWMGFTYHNSWPLLIVVAGVGVVIKALTREDARVLRDRADRYAARAQRYAERAARHAERAARQAERAEKHEGGVS